MPRPDESIASPVALRCESLCVDRRDRRVLHDIDLDVHLGQILAVVGPNGSGKTTLLAALTGDLARASGAGLTGTVCIGGHDIDALTARRRARVRATLTQHHDAPAGYLVRDIVAMGRDPHPRSVGHDERVIDWAMSVTETDDLRARMVHQLSGGETARVALARVLAQNTPVVLLDEPTAALDLRHQTLVIHVARMLAEAGRAVVVVLHDLGLAAWADRVALLHRGRLHAEGRPADLLESHHIERVYDAHTHQCSIGATGRTAVVPAIDRDLPPRRHDVVDLVEPTQSTTIKEFHP